MTLQSKELAHYWDTNLDPANLGVQVHDTTSALRREIEFARITPDIQEMLNWLLPPSQPNTSTKSTSSNNSTESIQSIPFIQSIPSHQTTPPPKILDVGTGLGTAAVLLRNRGATVIALDISHSRLAAMRAAAQSLSPRSPAHLRSQATRSPNRAAAPGKILPIKARAEALPFRDAALNGACSRAVLIHTDIPRACDEIVRALRPGAPVAFSEVMAHNPLVNLYRRTLAPTEWQSITTYFTNKEISTVKPRFTQGGSDVPPLTQAQPTFAREARFYQLAFLAFIFQYAIPARAPFRAALKIFTAIDKTITRIWPGYRRYAWFVLITGKTRQP